MVKWSANLDFSEEFKVLIAVIKSHLGTFPHTYTHTCSTESWQHTHRHRSSAAPFLPLVFFSFYFVFVLYKSVAHIQFNALRRPPLFLLLSRALSLLLFLPAYLYSLQRGGALSRSTAHSLTLWNVMCDFHWGIKSWFGYMFVHIFHFGSTVFSGAFFFEINTVCLPLLRNMAGFQFSVSVCVSVWIAFTYTQVHVIPLRLASMWLIRLAFPSSSLLTLSYSHSCYLQLELVPFSSEPASHRPVPQKAPSIYNPDDTATASVTQS